MMAISPSVQLRLEETERRNKVVPIQFKDMAASALAGAQTVQGLQEDKAKREKAAAFQKLLDSGLPAMQKAHQEVADPSLPDPSLFMDSRESIVAWYQLAEEKAVQKRGGAVIEKGGTYDEVGRGLVKAGAMAPKDYYSNARPGRAAVNSSALSDDIKAKIEKGLDLIEAQEREDGAVLPDADRMRLMRAAGVDATTLSHKSVKPLWEAGVGGESKEELRKTSESEKDRKTGLALKEDEIRDKREQRVIDEAQGFAKDTDAIAKTTTAIQRIHNVLEELGASGGIYTEDYSKVPGYGTGAKVYRDWLNDPAAVKLRQAVNILLLNKRKETAGSAVTPQEGAVLEKTLGINNRSTTQAFLESLRNFAEENALQLQSFEAGISDKAKARIKEKGGITSDAVPRPKPKGKAKTADDYLKEAGL